MSGLFRAEGQWTVFLAFVLAGVACGFLRDAVFGFGALACAGRVARAACGTLVGACAALVSTGVCFAFANGEPRFYMLLGFVLGALLYALSFGRVARGIRRFFRAAFGFCARKLTNNRICTKIFR